MTRTFVPTAQSVNGLVWVWKMKSSASQTPSRSSPSIPRGSGPAQADAEEHGVERGEHLPDLGARDAMAELDRDADLADHLDLGQCELGRDLVCGDPERVEAARQVAGLEDDHVVPEPAQLVGAAQSGRARADHGHALARGRARLEEPDAPARRRVAGEPLKPADLHRRLHRAC